MVPTSVAGSPAPPEEELFPIYVCGSYRDTAGEGREARAVLERLVSRLRDWGFDAFTQRDPLARKLVGDLAPAPMTRALERVSALVVYVGVPFGREGGWSAELSDAQARYPEGASKRVVLIRTDFPLSAVLDNTQEGHLSAPHVGVITWETEDELARVVVRLAAHLSEYGALPQATRRSGRVRLDAEAPSHQRTS